MVVTTYLTDVQITAITIAYPNSEKLNFLSKGGGLTFPHQPEKKPTPSLPYLIGRAGTVQ